MNYDVIFSLSLIPSCRDLPMSIVALVWWKIDPWCDFPLVYWILVCGILLKTSSWDLLLHYDLSELECSFSTLNFHKLQVEVFCIWVLNCALLVNWLILYFLVLYGSLACSLDSLVVGLYAHSWFFYIFFVLMYMVLKIMFFRDSTLVVCYKAFLKLKKIWDTWWCLETFVENCDLISKLRRKIDTLTRVR